MNRKKLLEILGSLISNAFSSSVNSAAPLARQLDSVDWSRRISQVAYEALGATVNPEEIESSGSLRQLSTLLGSRLKTEPDGRTIIDVYAAIERITREEYHPDIDFHWFARFDGFLKTGNWLTAPDSFDAIEVVMRMEEEFGFSIPDSDSQSLQTVEQAVHYLWRRTCAQHFALRLRREGACRSAFIFYELRRLIMINANVRRRDVRLDLQLGQVMPTWHAHFWKVLQVAFNVELPQGSFGVFGRTLKKNTTVKEIVRLVTSLNPDSDNLR